MSDYLQQASHPILSCKESVQWERSILLSAEDEWSAMSEVGRQLASGICQSMAMTGYTQRNWQALVLCGKGHNAGDALLALSEIALQQDRLESVTVAMASPLGDLKPFTLKALRKLKRQVRVRVVEARDAIAAIQTESFDLCLDGLVGMNFKPPLREPVCTLIRAVNESPHIRLRVAVDLPSGVGDESDSLSFRADVTFATGIFKSPLLENCAPAGLCRYLDIGFFDTRIEGKHRVLTEQILDGLRALRRADSEKRKFGHLAIVAGSRNMPGALAMSVRSALQSGVGLVTVLAPESVVSQLACAMPEAMWRSWPETPEGGLALEGVWQMRTILGKATALLLGPGMGAEKETQTLLCEIASMWDGPVLLDADALRAEVVDAFESGPCSDLALTPHEGELKRLGGGETCSDADLVEFAAKGKRCVVKKGSGTRISDGELLFFNPTGNAVLARGGSGDLLAGLIGGLLATGRTSLEACCIGVYWHGKAADLLAQSKGQTAVRTTDLLDFFAPALQRGR